MKLGIVCDYLEEGWFSMEICAQTLHDRVLMLPDANIDVSQIRPTFHRRFHYLSSLLGKHQSFNADRFINRYWEYPYHLQSCQRNFDFFHIADHSYAHLVHSLPAHKTGVFCHDLDAFKPILAPEQYRGTQSYRVIAKQILSGMQRAAIVFYTTQTVRHQIEKHQLIDPDRLVAAPLGVSPEYKIDPIPDDPISIDLEKQLQGKPFILHVGSCVPRKRIDLLLDIFAQLRERIPELTLVKVGGEWSQSQQQQIMALNIGENMIHLTQLTNRTIAALYQKSALVLITSEAEGFGLPVIEALACGAIVIASDIPVLREVGGDAVIYCPLGDIDAWATQSLAALATPDRAPPLDCRLARAACYSWDNHASIVVEAYRKLAAEKF